MLPISKCYLPVRPVSLTNGATNAYELSVDLQGYDYAEIVAFGDTANVVSNTLSVLKLQEADVTNSTSFADVTAFITSNYTIATNAYTSTSNANLWYFGVDCRYRKRYLRVLMSPQTTQIVGAVALLKKYEQAPTSVTKANVLNQVIG